MKTILFEKKSENIVFFITAQLTPLPHFHNHIELVYVIDGQTTAFADQKQTDLKKGDLFIAFPNQIHYYKHTLTGKYHVIIFSPALLYGMEDVFHCNLPKENVLKEDKIRPFVKLLTEFRNADGEFSSTQRVGLINQLFAHILPQFDLVPYITNTNAMLKSILEYCERNYMESITLDTLAENLHSNKFYISHLFNTKIGMNLNRYLNNLRVKRACVLLKESQSNILEISEDVGFGSIRSFNRAFKSIMHMTPITYRKRV